MCDRQRVVRRILLQALKDFAPRSCNIRAHEEIRRRMNRDRIERTMIVIESHHRFTGTTGTGSS
jgi:hypothetical protein